MKYSEIQKLSKSDREKKMKDLKMELIKSKTAGEKTGNNKAKQIKKIIARLHTFNSSEIKSGDVKK